jgi:hypothetical protein
METSERNHNCECGQPETFEHFLKDCPICKPGRKYLKETSSKLNLSALFNRKKSIEAVVKFLNSLRLLIN